MIFEVTHETQYDYESPVVLSAQLLHLTPRVVEYQRLAWHRIEVGPSPAGTAARHDYFGNPVTQIMLAAPHNALSVRSLSRVEVLPRAKPAVPGPWEKLRDSLRASGGDRVLPTLLEP